MIKWGNKLIVKDKNKNVVMEMLEIKPAASLTSSKDYVNKHLRWIVHK